MKKWIFFLCTLGFAAFAQNLNPNPGDIWTFFGPTLGGGWSTPGGTFNLATLCTGDGVADDAACLNSAATTAVTAGVELLVPGKTYGVCSASFAPPRGLQMRGLEHSHSKIQTLPGCVGPAATSLVVLPDTPAEDNGILPTSNVGNIKDVIFDGYGLSQYVISGVRSSRWSFPGVTVRNAKPSTVTTAITNATSASGLTTLSFAGTAAASVGALVDDLTRPGIIPPGATVSSCTPNCGAATTVTLSGTITNWDDGTGIGSGDTIRFMTPTANVYLTGGYELNLTKNFWLENINDSGHTLYTSQTTLPTAGIWLLNNADTNYTGAQVVNAMYGIIDRSGFGNVFGSDTHVWGQVIATGQAFDLRPQYGLAMSGANRVADIDVDNSQIAAVYVGSYLSTGMRITNASLNLSSVPVGGWTSAYGVLLASGTQHAKVVGTRAFDLAFNGAKANIVYQRGTPHYTTTVRDNDEAFYATAGRVLEGVAINVAGNQTIGLGPTGASTSNVNVWVMPNACYITGLYVNVTGAPGVGNTYTFTVNVATVDTSITGSLTGAGVFTVGSAFPPANTKINATPYFATPGLGVYLKLVASAAAPANNYSYRIYTSCQ